jgi:hypothetical protein
MDTTRRTTYLVRGSGPQSFVTCTQSVRLRLHSQYTDHTSGCALIMAIRRVLCGSSVYVQKKWSCSFSAFGSSCFSPLTVKLRGTGSLDGTVAVETEDRIVGGCEKQLRKVCEEQRGLALSKFVEYLTLSSALAEAVGLSRAMIG